MQRKWKRRWQRLAQVILPVAASGLILVSAYNPVYANPTGGTVTTGSVAIAANGTTMTISQTTDKAAINWQSFNIGTGEKVQFVQPSASSVALNRVVGNDASAIYGTLNANGKVYLINPNGILFAPGAQVNVGGLVASTLNISDSDFMNGRYTFSGTGAGSVVNQGNIEAANEAVFIGPKVNNGGVVAAKVTGLAAGDKVSLDFSGDSLLNITVDTQAAGGTATNSGTITAAGGTVIMSAGTKDALLNTVVNNSGVIRAQSINNVNGVIRLDGGMVTNSGTLDASGKGAGQTGGTVKVLGDSVTLAQGATIDVSGDADGGTVLIGGAYQGGSSEYAATTTTVEQGTSIKADALMTGNGGQVVVWANDTTHFAGSISAKGGAVSGNGGSVETSGKKLLNVTDTARVNTTAVNGATGRWLLDPESFTISDRGGNITPAILTAALSNTNVTITTGNSATVTGVSGSYSGTAGSGDITVSSDLAWSGTGVLSLSAYRNIAINADITINDMGSTSHAGLALTYGTGTSGNYSLGSGARISFAGAAPSLRINGQNYKLISNSTELQAISNGLSGTYALATDIVAGSFNPIGDINNSFSGIFDGLGHTIKNLSINVGRDDVGLFGCSSGSLRNVGLVGGSVIGSSMNVGSLLGTNYGGNITNCFSTATVNGGSYIGGLVGYNWGSITNSYSAGTVNGGNRTGGLVGYNDSRNIMNCYSTGAVNGNDKVGGLVGENGSGIITNCYSTGKVTGRYQIGGLVGDNTRRRTSAPDGQIESSYSTGAVSGHIDVGGLVGINLSNITDCYSTGAVTSTGGAGGLVGDLSSGSIKNSYWDKDTSGQTNYGAGNAINVLPLTSSTGNTAYSKNSYANFASFDTNWYIIEGQTRPFLRSEYNTSISNVHQLQLINLDMGAKYTLVNNIDMSELTQASGMWKTTVGFSPIGSSSTPFTGVFNGRGHTISNLIINLPSNPNVGLFGYSSATILNIGLVGGSVTGNNHVGSLVGYNDSGGRISSSFSTGMVGGVSNLGGLIGYNQGSIANSYSIGSVSGSSYVGGLIGYNNNGSIMNSYSTGAVTGTNYVGGFAGANNSSSVSIADCVWDQTNASAGQSAVGGGTATGITPLDADDMRNAATFSAWTDFDSNWRIYDGKSYPLLKAFLTPITLIVSSPGVTYSGSNYSGATSSYSSAYNSSLLLDANALTYSYTKSGITSGSVKDAGIYTVSVSAPYSTSQQGYDVTVVNSTLTITPATLTIAADAKSKVYGAADPALTYSVSGLVLGDTAGTVLSGGLTRTAGESVIDSPYYGIGQGSLAASSNYTIDYIGNALKITPAPLTIAADAKSKVYGAADPTLTYTVSGLVSWDTAGTVLSGGLTRTAGETVSGGPYGIGQGTLAANSNYSLSYTGNTLSITPAALTIVADAKSKVYGTADPSLTYAVSGLASWDTAGTVLTGGLTRAAGETVSGGPYNIGQGTLAANSNYTISSYTGNDLTITPAALTIAADAKSKVYGTTDPALTYSVSGLASWDTAGTVLTGGLTRMAGETVSGGPYGISQGALAANSNYTISSYTANALTITPAVLTIKANDASKYFGGVNPVLLYTTSGLVNGDTLSGVIGGVQVTTSATESSQPGDYAVQPTGTLISGNYTANWQNGVLMIAYAPWQNQGYYSAVIHAGKMAEPGYCNTQVWQPGYSQGIMPLANIPVSDSSITIIQQGINLDGIKKFASDSQQ